jgi:hypothetical protein
MALALRKSVIHATPAEPKCFSSWSGILLIPELLLALKWCWSTVVSSVLVMKLAYASVRGVNLSGGMVLSKKISLLNS